MEAKKARNGYIDVARGLAALSVIAIHTAFWSGNAYTPSWFKSLTLMLDVPLFFFLSGWAMSYRNSDILKTCKGLGRTWIQWIYFVLILALFCSISAFLPLKFKGVSGIADLFNNFMFNVSFTGFGVLAGSMWFMQPYFLVVFINTLIMIAIEKYSNSVELKKLWCILLAVIFTWVSYGKYFFNIDKGLIFYSFFWVLGQNRTQIQINSIKKVLISLVIIITGYLMFSYVLNIPYYDVQSSKFPPTLMYGFYAMIAIVIIMAVEPKVKSNNKYIAHIGKNALFYYFAQGIGSSLLYLIMDKDIFQNMNWFVKWIILFIINVVITVAISETLAYFWGYINKKINSISKKEYKIITIAILMLSTIILSTMILPKIKENLQYRYVLGETVDFSNKKSDNNNYAVEGLSNPESFGTWTDGNNVVMKFKISSDAEILHAYIDCNVFNKQQTVIISVNNEIVFNSVVNGSFNFEFKNPGEGNAVDIKMELPDAVSPKELGQSEDGRKLGLGLKSIIIEE